VSVAALPFACSVYGPADLQGWLGGQAGTGGDAAGQGAATAGDRSANGGGATHAAGTTGEGGSIGGGAPGMGGNSSGGAASSDAAGEAGTAPDATSGGQSTGASGASVGGASGASVGGAGAGTAGTGRGGGAGAGTAGAGAGTAGAGTAGAGTAGAPAITGLVASYPCESASGAVLPDVSGHSKNAALSNGSGGSPVFSFSAGRVGNALTLSSSDLAYVSLPHGLLSQLTEVTIATWVKLKSGTAFQRIFDFGIDTNTFMYLVNAGNSGFVRFRIVSTPLNKNQFLEGAEALPVGKWTHAAVTVGDNGVSIYVDGAQVAQQAPAALRPSDLGDTGNNFIGRSPFAADPYLDGQIDEFRIYNRVLSAAEIGQLASGQ